MVYLREYWICSVYKERFTTLSVGWQSVDLFDNHRLVLRVYSFARHADQLQRCTAAIDTVGKLVYKVRATLTCSTRAGALMSPNRHDES